MNTEITSGSPIALFYSFTLLIVGKIMNFLFKSNLIEDIALIFEILAWGGTFLVGIVTLLRWAQENGWVDLKKKKRQ